MTPQLLSDKELEAIKARADKATKGPWLLSFIRDFEGNIEEYSVASDYDLDFICTLSSDEGELTAPNQTFIAHSRTDIPALLSHAEAQRIELTELRTFREQHTAQLDALGEENNKLRYLLDSLKAAATGFLPSMDAEEDRKTNISVLQFWVDEARKALGEKT